MSVFNKIKNLFYEEEIIEEKVEPKVQPINFQRKEEVKITNFNEDDDIVSEREFVKKEENFKFPIIFEDEDIKEEKLPPKKVEPVSTPKPTYVKPKLDREVIKEVIEKPKKFTVSPVISPIYGILDKNYTKDEVTNKGEDKYKTKELVINFDTIRQKAYGSLEDELTDIIEGNKDESMDTTDTTVILEKEVITTDDLLDSLKVEEVETRTKNNNDMYDLDDFGVEYKLDDSGDDLPKHGVKNKKTTHKDKVTEEKIEDDNISDDEEKKEVEITDDLFNLIDSMYDN